MERSGVGTRFGDLSLSPDPKSIPQGGEKMKILSNDELPKNLMSISFDGHGGRAEEHRAEMEEIARKVYAEEH